MSAEPAEPVSAPIHFPVGLPPSESGSGVPGPADSSSMGVSLRYPSGQAGPLPMETHVKGPMLTPQLDMEISTSQSAVALSGSGIIDPDFGASAAAAGEALPPAAAGTQQQTQHARGIHTRTPRQAPATETPAAEGLTLSPKRGEGPARRSSSVSSVSTRPLSIVRSLSPPILFPAYSLDQSPSGLLDRGRARPRERSLSPNQGTFSYDAPSPPIGWDIEAEYEAAGPRLVDVWADAGPMFPPPTTTDANVDISAGRPESAIGVRLPVSSAGKVDLAGPARPAFVDVDRPGPPSGVRPPASTLSPSVAGPAPPRVVDVGRLGMYVRCPGLVLRGDTQSLEYQPSPARPTSVVVSQLGFSGPTRVDVARQPSLAPPASVDVASGLGRPQPGLGPPAFVDVESRQGLGTPMPVDVSCQLGLAPPVVGNVRRPGLHQSMLLVLLGLHLLVMYSSLAHSQPMLLTLLVKLGPCLLLSSASLGPPLLWTLQRTSCRCLLPAASTSQRPPLRLLLM